MDSGESMEVGPRSRRRWQQRARVVCDRQGAAARLSLLLCLFPISLSLSPSPVPPVFLSSFLPRYPSPPCLPLTWVSLPSRSCVSFTSFSRVSFPCCLCFGCHPFLPCFLCCRVVIHPIVSAHPVVCFKCVFLLSKASACIFVCLSRDIICVMAARSRWVILLLSCVIEFGHYYSLDTPASISNYLQVYMESMGGRSTVDFEYMYSMLYSCYCGPNLIMPVVAGFAIDRKGEAFVMGLFAICLPLGHIIFALGVMSAKWFLMMWGRAIVGVGAESVQMSLHVMLIRWFRGAEVTAAQGINLSVARMGSVLVAFMSPALCASAGINVAVLMGTIFSVAAFSATLVTVLCDRHFTKDCPLHVPSPCPVSMPRLHSCVPVKNARVDTTAHNTLNRSCVSMSQRRTE